MTAGVPADPRPRTARVRVVGGGILVAFAVVLATGWTGRLPLQTQWFDAYQAVSPRRVESSPVTIVEIDDRSLATIGRWPWPRTQLARLIHTISGAAPAAIGVDIAMPEADALSPDTLLARIDANAALSDKFGELPSTDKELASALATAPTVLIVAGSPGPSVNPLRVAPIVVRDEHASAASAARALSRLSAFPGAMASLPLLDNAASGWGFVSADDPSGVLRRVPLVANVNGTLAPALAVEMWRVALHAQVLRLATGHGEVKGVAVGERYFPTEADGRARIWFSHHAPGRFVSAIDVLEGRVDPARFTRKFVLIGVTAAALGDYLWTPVGDKMAGSEIHAQLLENMYDRTQLLRPSWAPQAEAAAFLLLGALLVWAVPRWPMRYTSLLALACVVVALAAAFGAFKGERLLFDAATPVAALILLSGVLLALTLADATRNRKALEQVLQRQREDAARVAGELQAAQRIQKEMLPHAELVRDPRIELAASMDPAQEVGGDLYDFYVLDGRRFFFMLGDVAGKGLSAAIFMAVSKALYKSAALRAVDVDVGALMTAANLEVARDNPSAFFVTVFAAVLDLDTGDLDYCNAGHENPWLVRPTAGALERLVDGGGPPLCAVEGYQYHSAQRSLEPGEVLCIVSDGVTEARDVAGALYGADRAAQVLAGTASAQAAVERLVADVTAFARGAAPADDITVLALSWRGVATGR
ncbi:MAG TPA: CHASE2 domain-containing protein [Casimicrobiaceae bacterium]|nr:CHASE2 domain-containing protein [Casimicrobiaceae bacterium]